MTKKEDSIKPSRSRSARFICISAAALGLVLAAGSAVPAAGPEADQPQRQRLAIAPAGFDDPNLIPLSRCGGTLTPEDLIEVQRIRRDGLDQLPEGFIAGSWTIPVTNHIIRRDDGTGGLTTAQVSAQMAGANALWDGTGIQFCQYGPTRFIDSNFWFNTQINGPLMDILRQIDVVPNTINVYWVPNFNWCGYSAFTWSASQGIVMKNSCGGISPPDVGVFAHELGHYFNLLHTHEPAAGIECTDGSNCATAGDLVCDTPADPGLGLGAWVNNMCNYIGTHEPPCDPGDPAYSPLGDNLMSYTSLPCTTLLTHGQVDRAVATLVNLRPELLALGGCGLAAPCGSGGSCFSSGVSAGCNNAACCAQVCAQDSFCCNNFWDGLCVNQANLLCQQGNTCANAQPTSDGLSPGLTLLGYGHSGNAGSCAPSGAADRWLKYTASCTGTATMDLCSELIDSNVSLTVFSACGSAQIACAGTNSTCSISTTLNARVSWPAVQGNTYLVRVAAPQTASGAFSGSIFTTCNGCGGPTTGSCLATQSGSPFCDWHDCCQYVCANDSFCCSSNWDGICANQANAVCTQACGSVIVGSCFDSKSTPHCDRTSCCNTVCAADAFCCASAWDQLCASAASTTLQCNVIEVDGIHFVPLGHANLGSVLNGVVVNNLGNSGNDGVRLNLDPAVSVDSINGAVAPMFLQSSSSLSVSLTTSGFDSSVIIVTVGNHAQSLNEILIGLSIGPDTHSVKVYNGNTLAFEQSGVFSDVVARSGAVLAPTEFSASVNGNEASFETTFPQPIVFEMGPQGFPAVVGDRIVVSSEQLSSPGGLALPLGTITRVEVRGAGMADFDIHDVVTTAPNACAGNCGDVTPLGCWCDDNCFAFGDCCADVCQHCGQFSGCATCPSDVSSASGPADGVTDIFDLLFILANWGACAPSPASCPADLSSASGPADGVVDIFDLLFVLANWGPCP